MKLFFSPGACSLSPHIVLREASLAFDLEKVDIRSKKTATGLDYTTINPKGYVPALALDEGQMLTEGAAIVQYLADRVPEKKLAPPLGSMERYRLQEWLNFISSEVHKGFSPLFRPQTPEEYKVIAREQLNKRIAYIAEQLDGKDYLMGKTFTVADAYLFTVLNWSKRLEVDLSPWPAVVNYLARVAARPAVREAMLEEGLIKP
ncbi:MAG: glutathione transferase GstA [Burkholderiales bacterium]|nr:glutathione transferase GstA [Burkholderiales bacterium]